MPTSARDAELKKLLTGLAAQTFDLENGPLFRARLFKLGEEEYALFFGCHHIVWDGWSFDILYTEMSGLYEAYAQGQTPTLPPLAVSYGDFAQWHNDWLKTSEIQQQFEFWKRHIGSATQLRVPAPDLPRRAGGNTRGGSEFMHISNERVEQIRELARRTGSTLSIVMLSVYSALVSQWLDEPTPAIGLPVRGRPNPELEAVMGFFNNMLPLRLHVDRSKSALAWIGEVRKSVTDAIANQDVPFEMLARETPGLLYQVMLTFQDARARPTHWGPLAHDRIPIMHEGATEDLNLWMVEITDGIEAGLQYNADAFLPDTARALRDRFLLALERLVTRPQQSLGELLQPADAELARLATWGTAPVTASATADIVDMAWQQLSTHPRSVAWQDGKRSLTRARLLGIVQKAQATLQARLTPGRDTIAVCCADPLAASIVALATLACNARILTLQSPLSNAASQALAERDDIAMLVTDTGPDIQGPAGLVQTNIADVAAVDAWHADAGRRNTDPVWGLDRGLLNALLANVQSLSPLSNRQAVWAVEGVATAGLVPWVMLAWAHGAAWVALNEADLSQGPHIKALAEKLAPRQIHAPARALRHLANLGATAKNAPCVWVDVGAASTALAQLGPEPGLRLVAYRSLPDLAIPVAAGLIEAGNFCNTFGKPLLGGLLSVVDATKQVVPVGVAGRLRWSDARYSVEDAATSVRWRSDGVLQYLSGPATDTPTADERSHNDAVVEAASDTESALLAIWRELLGRDEIGVTDNFFLVGGHSMLALRMMSEIHKRMGHQLPLSSLITASTVRQLAEHIDKPAPSDSVVLIRPGDSAEPPLFMVHDGDGETLLYRNLALRLTPGRAVYGLQPLSSDGLAMRHTRIADMAKHYADGIRKVQEHGPYFIGGLCAGGVIAFEVSRQLQEMGESVALTALLDIGDVQAPERRGREAGNRIKRFMKVFQNEEQAPLASHLRTSLTRATGKVRGYLSYAQDARTEESDVTQRAARLQECLDRQEVPDDDVKNLSVRQLYYFARAQHQPQGQLKGDVVLFRASNGDGTLADTPCIEMYAEPLFGWQQRVTGAVRTFDVPGGHSTMLQEPNVAVLASLMQEQIDRVASDAVESGDDTAQRRRAV
jgi:thioesterase domain-containing protein